MLNSQTLHERLSSILTALLLDNGTAESMIRKLMMELRPELYSQEEYHLYKPKYFLLHEFEVSATAVKHKLKNSIPNDVVRDNILALIAQVLDPAREALGSPIIVSSGYRSNTVNKLVGGVYNSKHLYGRAADVSCSDNDRLFTILHGLPHSELIYHKPHYIHIAL